MTVVAPCMKTGVTVVGHTLAGSILEGESQPAPDQIVANSQRQTRNQQANSQHTTRNQQANSQRQTRNQQANSQYKTRNLQANSQYRTRNQQANSQHKTQNAKARAGRTPQLGVVPGSEKIISVTDRTVTPSSTAGDSSPTVAESATESSAQLPASGWTARRPASDVQR